MLSCDLSDVVKGQAKVNFVPLLKYKCRYGCVVFCVAKRSYGLTRIINGQREFYLKTLLVTVRLFFNR